MSVTTARLSRAQSEDFTQDGRLLAIETPLGKDHLLLTSLNGEEALSRLFTYNIEMLSADHAIAPESLIGRDVKILISDGGEAYRPIHGVISRILIGPTTVRNFRLYRGEIVPWPWFLTQTTDCRIFQNLNIPDILSDVFKTFGFKDYELAVTRSDYPKLEFCVQYRESAFHFISRLMERVGIYYFFRHEEDRHVLVISDKNTTFRDLPNPRLVYAPNNEQSGEVTAWEQSYEFRSGRWAQTDFDFEVPSKNLLTSQPSLLKLPRADAFERFDYPGGYADHGEGTGFTRTLMQAEEAAYHVVRGASRYAPLAVGGRFQLDGHPCAEQHRYVVKSVSHEAADPTCFGNTDARPYYANSFEAIPYDVPFRPSRRTSRPELHGPQTALVVGPPGEKIFTDKYGRVRVQFHWDRYGKHDDQSSCWIRVSQAWAGKGWGNVNLPHVGHEVVVSFLEGDPDHPLITGRVYNGDNLKAMGMPQNKTQSAIRDHSGNEIVMEGKSGSEDIRLNATKDMNVTVAHDFNDIVKTGNRTIAVQSGTHTETIKGDTKIVVTTGKLHVEAAGNSAEYVAKNDVVVLSVDDAVRIFAKTLIAADVGDSHLLMEANGTITMRAKNVIIKGSESISMSGNAIRSVADQEHETKGAITVSEGVTTNTIKGGMVMLNPGG